MGCLAARWHLCWLIFSCLPTILCAGSSSQPGAFLRDPNSSLTSKEFTFDRLWNLWPQSAKPQVSIEVYYKTNCPHCLEFLRESVIPLVKAHLPGDRVKITILPYLESGKPTGLVECLSRPDCRAVLPPLCGLKGSLPPPAPADSPALDNGVRFAVCDLAQTAGGLGHDASSIRFCAGQAGIAWAEMEACLGGPQALGGSQAFGMLMIPENYATSILAAVQRFRDAGYRTKIGMPWVFFNGRHLACTGSACTAFRTPVGDEPLEQPGSLLYLACSKLHPKPAACSGASSAARAGLQTTKPTPQCENCAAFGSFRGPTENQQQHLSWIWQVLAMTTGVAAVVAVARAASHCSWGNRGSDAENGVE
mmetsp:Transcript_125975/g.251416  ORF Transcript_125975/g.251416 Transcript_125975/m.251416 type:complete len:364 (-) Transcript_125975:64-1155(-)